VEEKIFDVKGKKQIERKSLNRQYCLLYEVQVKRDMDTNCSIQF
jgi:hypothetical protein